MFALLLFAAAAAQPETSSPINATGGFVGVSVADLDKSVDWYRELLGLKIVLQPPERDGRRMIALEGPGVLIELVEERESIPLSEAAPAVGRDYLIHGIFKSGFLVSDYDGLLKRLESLAVPIAIGPFPATADQRANLIVRDPDGNFIQFLGGYARPAGKAIKE